MRSSIKLSERTKAPKSAIREVFDLIPIVNAKRAKEGLEPIISLAIGEPHLSVNPSVLNKLSAFLPTEEALHAFKYSPAQGRPETLDAIAKLYKHYYPSLDYSREKVMVTNGASQGLMNAFSIFIDKGDKVLVFTPYFSTYLSQINSLQGKLITISTEDNHFKPSAEKLRAMLQQHHDAKMLILNYPNNPSGVTLTKTVAIEMAEVLREYPNIVIVIDDVYRELNFVEHITLLDVAPDLKDRSIVINSGAKGLAGGPDFRIGMVGANKEWIAAMTGLQLNTVSGVGYLTQKALIAAVEAKLSNNYESQQWANTAKATYRTNVAFMKDEFTQLGFKVIPPEGGFFLLVNASILLGKEIPDKSLHAKIGSDIFRTDKDIVNYLLYAAGVAVVPGSGFGIQENAGYFRVSCAKDKMELEKAVRNIKNATESILIKEIDIKLALQESLFIANNRNNAMATVNNLTTLLNK